MRARAFLVLAMLLISRIDVAKSQKPRLGGAINVFSRYGYLSISMRVVPRNDSETWIFREPTLDVFHSAVAAAASAAAAPPPKAAIFEGDFHMEFCDNVRQLLQVKDDDDDDGDKKFTEKLQPTFRLISGTLTLNAWRDPGKHLPGVGPELR